MPLGWHAQHVRDKLHQLHGSPCPTDQAGSDPILVAARYISTHTVADMGHLRFIYTIPGGDHLKAAGLRLLCPGDTVIRSQVFTGPLCQFLLGVGQ